jgi:Ni/Co efflux regulator RcnB
MRATLLCLSLVAVPIASIAADDPAKPAHDHAAMMAEHMAMPGDAAMIESAMHAAPKAIGERATVVAMGADGAMRTLKQGDNGFTCMGDNPATPGPDPMCADAVATDWLMAYLGKKEPAKGKVGLVYMLEGGTDASNTDPYATAPTADNHWIKTGPHFMIVGAADEFYAAYPSGPDPATDAPYVMWAGTPYQHLMAPVK